MTQIEPPDNVRAHSYGYLNRRAPKEPKALEPTEAQHQQAVVQYCKWRHIPIAHTTNEGKRSPRAGYELKLMGLSAGFPDLSIPLARGGFHGLYIEMKRNSKATVTKEQRMWINRLNEEGYLALICCGADEAISQIDRYVRLANRKKDVDEVIGTTQQENA